MKRLWQNKTGYCHNSSSLSNMSEMRHFRRVAHRETLSEIWWKRTVTFHSAWRLWAAMMAERQSSRTVRLLSPKYWWSNKPKHKKKPECDGLIFGRRCSSDDGTERYPAVRPLECKKVTSVLVDNCSSVESRQSSMEKQRGCWNRKETRCHWMVMVPLDVAVQQFSVFVVNCIYFLSSIYSLYSLITS